MQQKAFVNPKIMVWARETLGLTPEVAAKRLAIKPQRLAAWEQGADYPTIKQAYAIATFYRRPFAIFFLNETPAGELSPHDYRIIAGTDEANLTPETRLAIRQAYFQRDIASEVITSMGTEATRPQIPKLDKTSGPEAAAEKYRQLLGLSADLRANWQNWYQAYNQVKLLVENYNVFVFQLSFPLEDARGFSLWEKDQPPIIVVNSKDHIAARTFTLFHEFCHLALRDAGLCDFRSQNDVEIFCNHFSGATLVPRSDLLNHSIVAGQKTKIFEPEDAQLDELAAFFKVSREVILRRLLILDRTTKSFYEEKRRIWLSQKIEKKPGFSSPVKKCFSEKGFTLVKLVTRALSENRITLADAGAYLGVRLKHLPEIQQKISTI